MEKAGLLVLDEQYLVVERPSLLTSKQSGVVFKMEPESECFYEYKQRKY